MTTSQIQARGIKDPKVLDAMRKVPRHLFVSEALMDQAYGDFPLPIGEQQTISQPYIVAAMTEALELTKEDRVLEIGTGSGYQAAILSQIAFRIYTIERIRSLYVRARKIFDQLNYFNIITRYSDGTSGWKDESPFDAIIVTAGAPDIPETLVSQLPVPRSARPRQRACQKFFIRAESYQETQYGLCLIPSPITTPQDAMSA